MFQFTKKSGQTYTVYTLDEARERGLAYKPWLECEAGEWGVSDDGFIGQCLSKKMYKDKAGRARALSVFSFGRMFIGKSCRLRFLPHWENQCFNHITVRPWIEQEARRARTRFVVKMFVHMMMAGHGVDWNRLGQAYRPDQQVPRATIKRLFRIDRIRRLIMEELKTALAKEGLDDRWIADSIKEAKDVAAKDTDAKSMLQAVQMVIDILHPAKQQLPELPGGGDDLRELIEAERKSIAGGEQRFLPQPIEGEVEGIRGNVG